MIKKNSNWKIAATCITAVILFVFMFSNIGLYIDTQSIISVHGWYIAMGVISCVIIAASGIFKFDFGKRGNQTAGAIVYVLSIFNAMNIAAIFCYGMTQSLKLYLLNVAFYFVFAAVALVISGRMQISALTALFVSFLFNVISFIIYSFRGQPLTPTDVYGIRTAMNVASTYSFQLKYQIITAVIVMIAQVFITCKFPLRFNFKHRAMILRLGGAGAALLSIIAICSVNLENYDVSVYDQYHANVKFGSAFSFYVNTTKMGLKKSRDYSKDKLNTILDSYSDENNGMVSEASPNIIVVMNESFSDIKDIGDFSTNIDYMPFFRSLQGAPNTITGKLMVSPVGGYTCNSEYEFLTGMNVGMLESQAIPYAQMIFNPIPYSMVTHMKGIGYKTIAFHPYYPNGWNRTNVYDFMGFDDFISINSMDKYNDNPDMLRNYISDKGDYDTIMNYLNSKEDQASRDFIMNVTMQNHGAYDYPEFENRVTINDSDGNYPMAEQYLTLIKYSDEALEQFLTELKNYDQPTIVLFFGDHQPNVEDGLLETLFGENISTIDPETYTKRYSVPFFIWANYDMGMQEDGLYSSPCFLSGKLMQAAGLPQSRVQMYLDDLQKDVMQVNPLGYYDTERKWHWHKEYDFSTYYDLQYSILKNEKLDYDFEFGKEENAK